MSGKKQFSISILISRLKHRVCYGCIAAVTNMAKIIHQKEKYIGCAVCVSVCPKFFKINEKDGLANLKNSEKKRNNFELTVKNKKDIDGIRRAANMCPVRIIKIGDD